jgi:hypothetical protein
MLKKYLPSNKKISPFPINIKNIEKSSLVKCKEPNPEDIFHHLKDEGNKYIEITKSNKKKNNGGNKSAISGRNHQNYSKSSKEVSEKFEHEPTSRNVSSNSETLKHSMDSSSRRADESNYDHLLTYSDRRTGYGLSQHGYVGDEIYNLMINGDKSQLQLMNDHKDDHGYETISLMYESDNESLGDILEIPIKENVKTSINYDDPFNGSMNYKDDIPDSKGENQNENFEKEGWFKPIYEVIGKFEISTCS